MEQITEPGIDGVSLEDWQTFILRTTKQGGGYFLIADINMNSAAAPVIEAGSRLEINGAFYKTVSNEGVSGGVAAGKNYVYAVPTAGGAYFQYSTAAPVWSAAKGGWFSGKNRAILRFEYTGGAFNNKVLMGDFNYDAILEAMKKMAGFDIPPDSAARTMVFQKTTQGESSISLPEGLYEVRMRGGPGGKGGKGGKGSSPTDSAKGEDGENGHDGGVLSGFFKVSGGSRVVYVDVGGPGGDGENGKDSIIDTTDIKGHGGDGGKGGDSPDGGGGGGGAGGAGTGVGSGQPAGKGAEGGKGYARSPGKCPVRTLGYGEFPADNAGRSLPDWSSQEIGGGKDGSPGGYGGQGGRGGNMRDTSPAGQTNGGSGGGGGGGGSSGISEELRISGGREPSASGAAVEIYRVTV
ncbi:MAG: hypothetical protein LBO04_00280 [Spirochaetaceae bacterium]|jgi:hypothetical protein|nr:hypothetical protein [Spirochaetaceae bacterium]